VTATTRPSGRSSDGYPPPLRPQPTPAIGSPLSYHVAGSDEWRSAARLRDPADRLPPACTGAMAAALGRCAARCRHRRGERYESTLAGVGGVRRGCRLCAGRPVVAGLAAADRQHGLGHGGAVSHADRPPRVGDGRVVWRERPDTCPSHGAERIARDRHGWPSRPLVGCAAAGPRIDAGIDGDLVDPIGRPGRAGRRGNWPRAARHRARRRSCRPRAAARRSR
jgi:hypothetical protein